MKAYLQVFALGAFVCSTFVTIAQNQGGLSPVVGTWKLVSSTHTSGNNIRKSDSTTIAEYKVITPELFMYSVFDKVTDTLIMSSIGKISIQGNQVSHLATYSTNKNRVGITATYTMNVKGNIMHQTGELMGTKLEEVWLRVY
jgi:hypothetical protein